MVKGVIESFAFPVYSIITILIEFLISLVLFSTLLDLAHGNFPVSVFQSTIIGMWE